jgi:hypothetical protein
MVPISPLDYIAQSLHSAAIGDGTPNAVKNVFPNFGERLVTGRFYCGVAIPDCLVEIGSLEAEQSKRRD